MSEEKVKRSWLAPDGHFYKYRNIDKDNLEFCRRIFTHNEIYLASRDQFNDPFDCKCDYSFSATDKEIKKYVRRIVKNQKPHLSRSEINREVNVLSQVIKKKDAVFLEESKIGTEEIISNIGIFSLSTVPDDILMWSHYADSHKGFCVVLKDDPNDYFIARALQVKYTQDYPIVNPLVDSNEVRMNKLLLTKSNHWAYENEWRIIDHINGPGVQVFPDHLFEGVILGCKMSEEHQSLLKGWCQQRKRPVNVYQAEQSPKTYSIDIHQISWDELP